jgi:glucose/arabinose dehydrogenase/PKD repeat protein
MGNCARSALTSYRWVLKLRRGLGGHVVPIAVVSLLGALLLDGAPLVGDAAAQTLPVGFQEVTVFSGLTNPTVVAFSPDGRVFVAEKSGIVKVFNSLTDPTPDIFVDLRTNVYNFWDRGLLGMALDPGFPTRPYVYLLYAYDAPIGGTAPRWGTDGVTDDPCPSPPGPTSDGCVISGRLSRFEASGNVSAIPEQVLIEDWCQQYPSHSIGQLVFGADGALYVSGGDGASFGFADWGQDGNPLNPCGDPPVPVGGTQSPPNARGGALRSQSLRRPAGEPVVLGGAVLRVNPDTGAALPTNPNFGHSNANARRIIAYGFRNPFRIAARPGTSEIWVGDVGWSTWEEINRIPNPTAGVLNFGWPCYEGNQPQGGYDAANLNLCETLYAQGGSAVVTPAFAYNHSANVVPADGCLTGSSSVSGLAFYNGGSYPASYNGALFFADYSRSCIWAMLNPPGTPPPGSLPPGLVAAYAFNEGTGTTTTDVSGNGQIASIAGATWTAQGRYGNALSFDGVNDMVTVGHSSLLNLTTGMTISAWVFPTAHGNGVWRNVIIKERPNGEVYNLYSNVDTNVPTVYVDPAPTTWLDARGTSQLPLNTWTHLAGTYDGTTLRLFVNGTQVGSRAVSGALLTSTGALRIGGNSVWGEFFQGRIDEVRVYNRALGAAELQTDINTPLPSTGTSVLRFVGAAEGPVNLAIGPGGDLFYTDFDGGTIRRIVFNGANNPPVAAIQATPTSGAAPLTVQFNASGSSDPDGDALTYSWDLNGDNVFGDSTLVNPAFTYTAAGSYQVKLRVTDSRNASTTTGVTIVAGTRPVATINAPSAALTWKVGDPINFSGSATDAEDGALPATALTWTVILHHCPSTCHTHPVTSFVGTASGSFVAPDHEYPSHIELQLTARDSTGLTDTKSVLVQPQTAQLSFQTNPTGLQLAVGSTSQAAPFNRTVILGSTNTISGTTPQVLNGTTYTFVSWSDGGAQSHNIVASAPATYTATYEAGVVTEPPGRVAAWSFNAGSGTVAADVTGSGRTGTISGAGWTTQGKYGNALSFDGVNDWVTVADHNSLDLTVGMTLSAWVFPTAHGNGVWRNVIIKERPGGEVYNLYSNVDTNVPTVYVDPAANVWLDARGTAQLPLNTWTHLTATYDGATLRLFVNGVQVGSRPVSGALLISTGALRIGGNSVWGEFFQGRIDEVRVHNRALSTTEIQTIMNLPLTP